jgi:hypothetical protein
VESPNCAPRPSKVQTPSNVELNLTGGLWQQLARDARELHFIGSAGRLTPAR